MNYDELLDVVKDTFVSMLRLNLYEAGYSRLEIEKRSRLKQQLRKALKDCTYGDDNAKNYIMEHIKEILLQKLHIDHKSIGDFFDLSNDGLSIENQFLVVMCYYKEHYGEDGLNRWIEEYHLDKEKYTKDGDIYYEITTEDFNLTYLEIGQYYYDFNEQLSMLIQKIYQDYKGNSVIDQILEMNIDGLSVGVTESKSIWLFYKGKTIHMSFLHMPDEKVMIRVCKNIYKYHNPGYLSENTGFIVNERMDGSRVAVARPPFCESWALFIRKFDSVSKEEMKNLIIDRNSNLVIILLKYLMKGRQVVGITGQQGTGKTTLLMALIQFISPSYNLRIQELSFELHLRKIYPERNIVSFKETESVKGKESLEFMKKTDGTVNILGEVASDEVASWLISMSQVASLFTLFTHHAKTTDTLIRSMRNALLMEGGFQNERIAMEQVVDAVGFDVHLVKDDEGHRYVERITEIIPDRDKIYETCNIIEYHNGVYYLMNPISKERKKEILKYIKGDEVHEFEALFIREELVENESYTNL